MDIEIHDFQLGIYHTSEGGMAESAPIRIDISERVPTAEGEAIDLQSWYKNWRLQQVITHDGLNAEALREPTHLKVEAVDEFQAVIPWSELGQAALLYQLNGAPLQKGFPLRLYVPDGSSKCLNVKSINKIYFIADHDGNLGNEAVFGFKNELKTEDLKKVF